MADKRPTNAETYKTAEERAQAFYRYCDGRGCNKCPINDRRNAVGRDNDHVCLAFWMDMEADCDDDVLECPFCGKGIEVWRDETKNWRVSCVSCLYNSGGRCDSKRNAIKDHNNLVRLVRKARRENG